MYKIILIIGFTIFLIGGLKAQLVDEVFEGTDSTTNVVDTLSRNYTDSCNSFQDWDADGGPFNKWYRATLWVDDTCYVSTDATFPSYSTFTLYPNESRTRDRYNVILIDNFYIKSNSTDVANYRWSLEGF